MSDLPPKQCCKCKVQKPATEYHRSRSSRDGLHCMCKDCNRENSRQQRLRNREHLCELQRAWTAKTAEARKPYKTQYYKEHREEIREQARARYAQEYPNNPNKYLARCHKRRAAINGNGGSYTNEEWVALCAKYGNICVWCDRKVKLTVDHIVPLAQGGSNDINNIQPLCRRCNAEKGNRIMNFRHQHDYFIENFLQDT